VPPCITPLNSIEKAQIRNQEHASSLGQVMCSLKGAPESLSCEKGEKAVLKPKEFRKEDLHPHLEAFRVSDQLIFFFRADPFRYTATFVVA
jgi:hypothetical protein